MPDPQTSSARIDVLIPAYNAAATIRGALASIQQQSVADIRLVVIDDGSTDGTGAILDEIAGADPRVTVLHTANRGLVSALNHGLAHCTAEYVARHDADDIAFPERFAEQLAYLEAHPDCIAVGANAWHIDETGARTGTATRFGGDVEFDPRAVPSREPYLLHPFLMLRRRSLVEAGGYRHAFHSEDTDLYWRLLSQGRLHSLPAVLGEYRIHGASISSVSVLNGRVSAANSQLAAISFLRRQAGRGDLAFPAELLERYHRADSLERIVALAAAPLDPDEARYLEAAVAAKLVQLAGYRPYHLTLDDCRTIRRALDRPGAITAPDDIARMHATMWVVTTKLTQNWKYREALALAPARLIVKVSFASLKRRLRAGSRAK